jgi:hypothetical protein
VAPPLFECPFSTQKEQSTGPGHSGLEQSATGSALILMDSYQKLLVSAQETLGFLLGFLALVVLGDRVALALG